MASRLRWHELRCWKSEKRNLNFGLGSSDVTRSAGVPNATGAYRARISIRRFNERFQECSEEPHSRYHGYTPESLHEA